MDHSAMGHAAKGSTSSGAKDADIAGAEAQILTWVTDDRILYLEEPTGAVAGPATIVLDNTRAVGMPHTVTFENLDINVYAAPGERISQEVVLPVGSFKYYCVIPGHQFAMQGTLVVTGGGTPTDTTAPTVSAALAGPQSGGNYTGPVTVTLTATDNPGGSGVASVEYSVDNGAFTAYTTPFTVSAVGAHTVRDRATDVAGNVSPVGSSTFTIANPTPTDTTPPTVTAALAGPQSG
ncbi:hypothetical protein G9H72_19335, partial [Motilibacter sp. K478]